MGVEGRRRSRDGGGGRGLDPDALRSLFSFSVGHSTRPGSMVFDHSSHVHPPEFLKIFSSILTANRKYSKQSFRGTGRKWEMIWASWNSYFLPDLQRKTWVPSVEFVNVE